MNYNKGQTGLSRCLQSQSLDATYQPLPPSGGLARSMPALLSLPRPTPTPTSSPSASSCSEVEVLRSPGWSKAGSSSSQFWGRDPSHFALPGFPSTEFCSQLASSHTAEQPGDDVNHLKDFRSGQRTTQKFSRISRVRLPGFKSQQYYLHAV